MIIGYLGRKAVEDPKEIPQDHICRRPGILLQKGFINKAVQVQDLSKITFVIIFNYVYIVCYFVHYLEDQQDARVDPWLM